MTPEDLMKLKEWVSIAASSSTAIVAIFGYFLAKKTLHLNKLKHELERSAQRSQDCESIIDELEKDAWKCGTALGYLAESEFELSTFITRYNKRMSPQIFFGLTGVQRSVHCGAAARNAFAQKRAKRPTTAMMLMDRLRYFFKKPKAPKVQSEESEEKGS